MKKPKLQPQLPTVALPAEFLLLDFIEKFSSDKFLTFYEELKNKGQAQKTEDVLKLFKFKNCTYLTETALILMADNLFNYKGLIEAKDAISLE